MAEVEIKNENLVYAKPKLITDNVMHYCPGCSHGTVHKLIAEVIEEMGFAEKMVVKKLLSKISDTDIEKLLKKYQVI